MLVQDQILSFLKAAGPTLPAKVAKNIKTDVLIASAHLADLVSQGKVKLSNLKVGGSPLYYLPGYESQLFPFAAGNINPKDLAVLEQLKFSKVLRETDLDLLPKVALRALKDFAVPLHVRFQGQMELFWKWHMASDDDTNRVIGAILNPPVQEIAPVAVPAPSLEEPVDNAYGLEDAKGVTEEKMAEPSKPIEVSSQTELEKEVDDKKVLEKDVPDAVPEKATDKPAPKKDKIEKGERAKKKVKIISLKKELLSANGLQKKIGRVKVPVKAISKKMSVENSTEKAKEVTLKTDETSGDKQVLDKDIFLFKVTDFMKNLEIKVDEKKVIRKNAEYDFLVKVSSIVGEMRYFCKAKAKSKCDEKDLSGAYMEAQIKKLPLLFLYNNQLTKKATDMLNSGAFENVVVKKIQKDL
jgi:hypothetical protein